MSRAAAAGHAAARAGGRHLGVPPFSFLFVAVVASALPGALAAQDPAGTLRGQVVVAGTDLGLPYSAVLLGEPPTERFVGVDGRFVLRRLAPGTHRLRVRRIGYRPVDTVVVVPTAGPAAPLRVALARLPQQLAAVRVPPVGPCRTPGPPRADADPAFAAVFEQMEQNAAQYRLLVRAHPFSYAVVRHLVDRLRGGRTGLARTDTLIIAGESAWRYAPGRVVTDREGPRGRERVLNLATLVDFADPAFQATHCFDAGGVEELDGRTAVRIDFRAAAALRAPDVDGAIYLDASTYQILAADVALTRASEAMRGVGAVTVRTTFREIAPGVPIIDGVAAEHRLRRAAGGAVLGVSERQRLLEVRFDGEPLPGARPPP